MFKSALSSFPGSLLSQTRLGSHLLPKGRLYSSQNRLLKEAAGPGTYFKSEGNKDTNSKQDKISNDDDHIEQDTKETRTPTTEERLQKLNNHEHRIILDKSRAVSKHHHKNNNNDNDNPEHSSNEHEATEQAPIEDHHNCEPLIDAFNDMDPYIDTHGCFVELRNAGFTVEQADIIIKLLLCLLNDKLGKLATQYAQNYELENEQYLFESAQEELRVDVTRSRELHIHEMISLINILERDFSIISDELTTELINMKNTIEVTINDQRQENTLLSKMFILKIQEANHKITTELISSMRSEIESLRWNLSRWGLMAIITSLFMGCSIVYFNRFTRTNKQERHEFTPLVIYEPSELEEDDYHDDLDRSVV